MKCKKFFKMLLVAVCLIFSDAVPGMTTDYPNKPITLIIPFGAGGSHDLNARVFSAIIHQYLGQPFIVKLMPGSGGQLGAAAAVKAKPDGYTLFYSNNWIDQLQPLIEKLPYDLTETLVTVCRTNYSTGIYGAMKDRPWNSMDEIMAWAKKNPNKLIAGHAGMWGTSFTIQALIFSHYGVQVKWIGYKGGGPLKNALLAGEVDFAGQSPIAIMSEIRAGNFKPFAISGNLRHPDLPDVPSFGELGVTDEVMHRIVQVPRATPPERIEILRTAFRKLNKDKTFQRLITRLGENAAYIDGPEYEKLRANQKITYKKLITAITGQ